MVCPSSELSDAALSTSQMTHADISVIIPTYNGSSFISEALRSVFAQTLLPKEIIVVDDCSTDGTIAIVEQLRGESPVPLHVERLPTNSGGPSKPINAGISRASGSVISVLDQDDLFLPEMLESAERALAENEDAGFAFHWCDFSGDDSRRPKCDRTVHDEIIKTGSQAGDFYRFPPMTIFDSLLRFGTFIVGFPGFVFRKSLWEAKGGIDEKLKVAGDLDILFYLSQQSGAVLIPKIGYLRRFHDFNASSDRSRMRIELAQAYFQAVRNLPVQARADRVDYATSRLTSVAYWLRELQRYEESIQMYRMANALDRRASTSLALFKVYLHKAWSATFAISPHDINS